MSKKTKKTMSRGKKFLVGLGVVVLLVALFFVSFWVTTLSLRANREPNISTETGAPAATAAPEVNYKKLSKKELIELLEEKDELIEELNKELGRGALSTQAPIEDVYSSSTNISEETEKPAATEKPATKATEKPAVSKATPKPTPTKAPAPKPTTAPKPAAKPAEPTKAPVAEPTKAPSIKPVAPAADSE